MGGEKNNPADVIFVYPFYPFVFWDSGLAFKQLSVFNCYVMMNIKTLFSVFNVTFSNTLHDL